MSDNPGERAKFKPIDECQDVYDVLENVRTRPGMWVRNGSLQELMTLLFGYFVALQVHEAQEPFELAPVGPFAEWLRGNHGWSMACGWATAIEQHVQDEPAMDAFFRLLDEYRVSTAASQASGTVTAEG